MTAKGIVWLIASVLMNALGNALTIKASVGSAPWTAASLNLSSMSGLTVGNILVVMGFIVLIVDDVLRRHWNGIKDVFNFLYLLSFGYVIDAWLFVLQPVSVNSLILRIMICVVGLMCIGAALSIYFRVNLCLHPFDDLMKILREKYLHGNVVLAQWISLGIPLLISLPLGLFRHHLIGINIGTVISFLCMGYFILLFDRIIHLHLERKWTIGLHIGHRVKHSKA